MSIEVFSFGDLGTAGKVALVLLIAITAHLVVRVIRYLANNILMKDVTQNNRAYMVHRLLFHTV